MDRLDQFGARDREQVVAAAQVARMVGEPVAAVLRLVQPVLLDHGAHGTVEDQDPLGRQAMQPPRDFCSIHGPCGFP